MLSFRDFSEYCQNLPDATKDFPFGPDVLVFKVNGKMFALCPIKDIEQEFRINLKSDPGEADFLREQYTGIKPGYHMNKKHWITLDVYEGDLEKDFIFDLIDKSFVLVGGKL